MLTWPGYGPSDLDRSPANSRHLRWRGREACPSTLAGVVSRHGHEIVRESRHCWGVEASNPDSSMKPHMASTAEPGKKDGLGRVGQGVNSKQQVAGMEASSQV